MGAVFMKAAELSLYASVFFALLLVVRWGAKKRASFIVALLWGALLFRLALPVEVQSPVSVMNLARGLAVPAGAGQEYVIRQLPDTSGAYAAGDTLGAAGDYTGATAKKDAYVPGNGSAAPSGQAVLQEEQKAQPDGWTVAAIVWLCGMAAVLLVTALANIRFFSKLRRKQEYMEEDFQKLLAGCMEEMRMKRRVCALRMDETETAAVCGVFRPKLLINPEAFEYLDDEEKRHILLHELAHIKRLDPLISLAAQLLRAVYWFNPLLQFAFTLMQKDMEVLCDAYVLRKLGEGHCVRYAATLLKLAENASVKKGMRLVMAVSDRPSGMKKRILMAMRYRRGISFPGVVFAILAVLAIAAGCTSAVVKSASESAGETAAISQVTNSAEYTGENTALPSAAQPSAAPGASALPSAEQSGTRAAEQSVITGFSVKIKNKSEGRIYNIKKALAALDGKVIAPGETLSFNETVGSRTAANGWKTAAGIVNGVYSEQTGGGACVASTLLYISALQSELEIVERVPHAWPAYYVPGGLDATVSTGGPDLKVKNTGASPVTIKTGTENGKDGYITATLKILGEPLPDGVSITATSKKVKDTEQGVEWERFLEYRQNGKIIKTVSIGVDEYKFRNAERK